MPPSPPPQWLTNIIDMLKEGQVFKAVYQVYYNVLGQSLIAFIALTVGGIVWMRGGAIAAGAFLTLTGALFASLMPPQAQLLASMMVLAGLGSLFYGLIKR